MRLSVVLRLALLATALLLGGCSTLGYYAHLARGQWAVLAAREPIADILADASREPRLRERLKLALQARRWAVAALALPDNASYTLYADVHRPFVLWNVFATPELSLEGIEHCFPVAGCVAYRGYYDEAAAKAEAARLAARGLDSHVAGVPAYSTLGWFDDPILSPMLRWDDEQLVASLFHELAHQQVYAPGDTAFNESYASFVEQEGLRQWRAVRGLPAGRPAYAERQEAFLVLAMRTRERLEQIYASDAGDAAKRAAKASTFAAMQAEYAVLKTGWGGWPGYDRYFATPLNNAKLLPFGLYHQWVPAFAALFAEQGRDWRRLHEAVRQLATLDADERLQGLSQLTPADAPPY